MLWAHYGCLAVIGGHHGEMTSLFRVLNALSSYLGCGSVQRKISLRPEQHGKLSQQEHDKGNNWGSMVICDPFPHQRLFVVWCDPMVLHAKNIDETVTEGTLVIGDNGLSLPAH